MLQRFFFMLLAAASVTASAAGFDLTDTTGKHHRLADYGGRWVVINYWATWCVPCVQEIPDIAAFHRDHPDVAVIGIAIDAEDVAKTKQFAAKVGLDYPLVISDAKVEKQLEPPKGLPTTRIYDPSGKLVFTRLGRVTRKDLEGVTARATSARATLS
ncbi:MAG: TlpA family protein disulfide reductase [Bacillota bacterium]